MRQSREVKAVSGWEDKRAKGDRMIGWRAKGRADHPWSAGGPGRDSTTCCPRGNGAKGGRDGDHVPTLDTARSARSADPTQGRWKRLEVSGLGDCRAKGDRKPDDWLGRIFRSHVSAIGTQGRVIRFRFGKSAIRPRFSPQRSPPFSPLSSIQP